MLVLPSSTAPAALKRCDDRRVVGTDKVAQHLRPAGRQPALGTEDVLVGDRDAGQRTAFALSARRSSAALAAWARLRGFGIDADESVELRVVARDPVEVLASQLDAGNFFRGQCALPERLQAVGDHSMTFRHQVQAGLGFRRDLAWKALR
jgi:hypothetical protein